MANFVVSLCFPTVTARLGGEYAFAFFGVVSCFGFVALFFYLPETVLFF
jgi:hypothetical protein